MKHFSCLVASLLAVAHGAKCQDGSPSHIEWQEGPSICALGVQATIKLSKGYLFADSQNTRKFLELSENIPSGKELGILAKNQENWFVIFDFDPTGYVRDSEKNELDADNILNSIKAGTVEENKIRQTHGWGSLTILGWKQAPFYDPESHQLTWSLRAVDEKGQKIINYHTRILGRRGIMNANLVSSEARFDTAVLQFKDGLSGYSFTPDNRYSAWLPGDKVSEYGLAALIVGGGAAAGVKVGLFKYLWKLALVFWKFILLGFAAIGSFLKRLFRKSPLRAEGILEPEIGESSPVE